jgi:uncharacterized metal-binding protein
MPAGRTHDRITLISLPVVGGAALFLSRSSSLTLIVCAGFLFSGLMFGPDLDIYSCQYKRWGWLRWLWLPYRKFLPHRSLLSHGPVVGTLLRLIYLGLWIGLIGMIGWAVALFLGQAVWDGATGIRVTQSFVWRYALEGLALLVGLELGAMSHYLSDWSGSVYHRCKRRLHLKGKR